MNSLLSHHHHLHTPGLPGWGAWYEKYRRSINLKLTMRTVQRKLAQFRGEEPTGRTTVTRGTKLTTEQATAAKNLADAKEQFGAAAAAGNESAAAIIAEYEQACAKAMADDVVDALTVLTSPDDGDFTASVDVMAARAAAIKAAKGVTVDDLRPHFYPVMRFHREGGTVGDCRAGGDTKGFAELHGMTCVACEGDSPYTLTSYVLLSERFHTTEQAYAYAKAFAKALPDDWDVFYGIAYSGARHPVVLGNPQRKSWQT